MSLQKLLILLANKTEMNICCWKQNTDWEKLLPTYYKQIKMTAIANLNFLKPFFELILEPKICFHFRQKPKKVFLFRERRWREGDKKGFEFFSNLQRTQIFRYRCRCNDSINHGPLVKFDLTLVCKQCDKLLNVLPFRGMTFCPTAHKIPEVGWKAW